MAKGQDKGSKPKTFFFLFAWGKSGRLLTTKWKITNQKEEDPRK